MFRWALLDLRLCYYQNVLTIWGLTDRTCFNVLRWTPKQPILRRSWPVRRGIPHEFRDKWLDTEWRSIGQNEPGFTTIKTFTWPSWPATTRRWWLLTAKPFPIDDASQSPLYLYTSPPDPTWATIFVEQWTS